ncbi:MAG: metallophosphoesterase family protein [Sphingomonas sp.]|jgi:putative phosphoesterase|uniref:metallophosphoesterase family protein n=1 Tax=Sphingomonas sp. TaxID=28214 RepID=UPI0035676B99
MRFALVSDIHGNLPALEAVAADIRSQSVDAVINLGDSLSGPLLPRQTAQFLMAADWLHVAGNHDRQILELGTDSAESDRFAYGELGADELGWLATLPSTCEVEPDVLACHGTPHSDVTCLLEEAERPASAAKVSARLADIRAAVILCGHSHVPRSVRSFGRLVVNPGSVGQPAYADDHPHPHVIESGSPDARYALLEQRAGVWRASLISVPYASEEMASLAASRGRPDWAAALRTGYVS